MSDDAIGNISCNPSIRPVWEKRSLSGPKAGTNNNR